MLRSLHVRNYVLIDSLDVEFPEGLVIITGATGAGKSILLGALSLLTGAKADAATIAAGADSCVVEGEFDAAGDEIKALLEEADVEWADGNLLIRRVVHSSGRSRSFINDSPVPVQLLSDIASQLVDIHSQHQNLLLTSRSFQLGLLDHFAGNDALREEISKSWRTLQDCSAALESSKESLKKLSAERDYNQAQFDQLDGARLRDSEMEELEEEQKQLAHAEQIKSALAQAMECFTPGDESLRSVSSALRDASRSLEKVASYVPSLSALCERIDSSRIELEDIESEICSTDSSIVLSEDRLAAVDERISLLLQLMRKHSVNSIAELIAIRDRFNEALYDSDSLEEKIAELEKQLKAAQAQYDSLAAELRKRRTSAAPSLASSIQESIRSLELDRAVFCVDVAEAKPGASGSDAVYYKFSSNDTAPEDLAKCASGGEISRIMLCLKAMMARFAGMPTMVFDEIDTGVSGSVAHKMGRLICQMGADMQVFAITHLPQVAAKGSAHFVVEKAAGPDGRVISRMRELSGEERVGEIARLLSGETITAEALANAQSLLNQ